MTYLLRLDLTPAHRGNWLITDIYGGVKYITPDSTLYLWDARLKVHAAGAHRIHEGLSSKHACAWVQMDGYSVVARCNPSILVPELGCYYNPRHNPHWLTHSGAVADGLHLGFAIAHQRRIYRVPGWALCSYPLSQPS